MTFPSGTVTFVLGDVEGSVRLWESQPKAMADATSRFDALVSELAAGHDGARPEEQGEGDSFVTVFAVAQRAVSFVVALQRTLASAEWATALSFRVRTAVHTGAAQFRDSANYMGPAVNRCARIRALGHGGQVLLSGATAGLLVDDPGAGTTLIDLGLHQLRDFDRPERVFQLAHPDLPASFPALRDHGEPGRIPVALTSFVAREHEMKTVGGLLARERLVTLTGAGGSGKTRLALECARRRLANVAAPVAWVDAAPIADGALLASSVATGLGVREVPSEPIIETIAREVGDSDTLIVLDNCEHVIDDAARLVEHLLAQCARLHILATSREPVGVLGEAAMRVPSLDEDASVSLFVDRARSVRSGFALTPDLQGPVREICRRLDGIPLAIELAAARVRVLTPQQIADGLADRFRLLTGGSRTALPRQRTLEASVDWSYRLLSASERTLLARLSVFAGGFTLDAVRGVCADDTVPEASILDLLTALVDKSLVLTDPSDGRREARYRMLETIRHFAQQRLADADAAIVRDHHLRHFLAMAEDMGPRIERGDELVWLDQLEAEIDNLRAALDWAHQRGESQQLLRLTVGLWLFYEVSCRFEEGKSWLRTALAATPERTRTRAAALHGLGDISLFTLDLASAISAGEEAVAIGEQLDDASVIDRGLAVLGWVACLGAYRDTIWARESLTAMVERPELDDDPWLRCDATMALGLACTDRGDLIAAARAFEDAVQAATRWRGVSSLQRALYFRGWLRSMTGEINEAEPDLRRSVELADALHDTFWRALSLAALAQVHLMRGQLDAAEAVASESMEMGERFGNPFAVAFGGALCARTLITRGEDDRAQPILEAVRPVAGEISLSWLSAYVESTAALACARSGNTAGARAILDDLAPFCADRPYAHGLVALCRGAVDRIAGDEASAEDAFTVATTSLAEAGALSETAAALEGLGVSAAHRGQHERATRLFAAADGARARLGVTGVEWAEILGRRAVDHDALLEGAEAADAMSLAEAVRYALRGKGGRRRPAWGWESLTPTEADVVSLVRHGLTNPVIAERLGVSRGTVKVHLSHIFAKLGVASRAELAAGAARREHDPERPAPGD